MAGTFGQQLKSQRESENPQRFTRTQRLRQNLRDREEQMRYEELRTEAQRLQKEVFVDRPNDPFTDEDYANEYAKLSPELRQFFASPQEILEQKQNRINENKAQANSMIDTWKSYSQDARARLEKYQEWWLTKSKSYRDQHRQTYRDRVNDYLADINEYESKIQTLKEGFGKIEQGYDWKDFKDYAEEKAQASREKSERQKELNRRLKENPKLIPVFSTENRQESSRKIVSLIDPTKTPLPEYLRNQESLTQADINYYKSISNWVKVKGYNQVSQWAKENVINPSIYKWQRANPTEAVTFNERGEVIGIMSQQYGETYTGIKNIKMAFVPIGEYKDLPIQQFEQQNPDEKVMKDENGNPIYVNSKKFGAILTLSEYNKKVSDYNDEVKLKQAEALQEQEKQLKLQEDAKTILDDKNFGEGVSLTVQDMKWYEQAWAGAKALYYSSLFGASMGMSESTTKSVTDVKENTVVDTLTSSPLVFKSNAYKLIFQYPIDKSYNLMVEQRQLDYKEKEAGKMLQELDKISSGVPEELKPIVQAEGLKILQGKGLDIATDISVTKEGDDKIITSTMKIIDPAFERRISQNIYEWEIGKEINKEKNLKVDLYTKGTGFYNPNTKVYESSSKLTLNFIPPSDFQIALATRIVSVKAVETYALWKGTGLVLKGVGAVTSATYNSLGGGLALDSAVKTGTFTGKGVVTSAKILPTWMKNFLATKTVILKEGTAVVPRNYGLLRTTLGVGLTSLYGFAKYQQYQQYKSVSPYGKDVFWMETVGELAGVELATGIGRSAYRKGKNIIKNLRLKTIRQADISQQGFLRENKLIGGKERVYMDRYEGLKLSKPRTWKQYLQGYRKGQFTGRVYKYLPDEVTAYYQYGGDVTVTTKKGVVELKVPSKSTLSKWADFQEGLLRNKKALYYRGTIKREVMTKIEKQIRAEAFPYDNPSTHKEWFIEKNIAEYPVPQKSKLPISVRGKAFGYSATGEAWQSTEFEPEIIAYVDKAGKIRYIKTEGAIQYVSGKGVSGGFLRVFEKGAERSASGKSATDPIIYSNYFDDMQINKAIKEIKGVDTAGRELKYYIYTKPVKAGTLQLPLSKQEVEGTVEIVERIPIRKAFKLKLAGWSVPIEEQIFTKKSLLSAKELLAIEKSVGSVEAGTGALKSSLPLRASYGKAIFSVSGTSRSSILKSRVYSKISRSEKSASSYISGISYKGSPKSSDVSDVKSFMSSSNASNISSSPSNIYDIKSSIIERPTRSSRIKPFSSPKFEFLRKQIKQKIFKPRPEIIALMPDFTSRALGIRPKKFSVKDALKEMKKIQTGFELRTGGTLFDERKLLKGITK